MRDGCKGAEKNYLGDAGDRLFQSNSSNFGVPPALVLNTQSSSDTTPGASARAVSGIDSLKEVARVQTAQEAAGKAMNSALVVIEKSILTEEVIRMVKATLKVYGITCKRTREIPGRTVRARGIVDQHFRGVSRAALLTSPKDLEVSDVGLFSRVFGIEW